VPRAGRLPPGAGGERLSAADAFPPGRDAFGRHVIQAGKNPIGHELRPLITKKHRTIMMTGTIRQNEKPPNSDPYMGLSPCSFIPICPHGRIGSRKGYA